MALQLVVVVEVLFLVSIVNVAVCVVMLGMITVMTLIGRVIWIQFGNTVTEEDDTHMIWDQWSGYHNLFIYYF